ncbi:hypothetical protein DES53_104242 [Roseimicrobium gellanilyticum]|uniref:Uncharacterized protein n=1 Tax=Roseimicrobium gellanilyticum TaxID=748857 RepID=A0A366HMN4_9BACT|nr:hypothetical protein DES53_104242 [Roseimicrobium gellanilyticum]
MLRRLTLGWTVCNAFGVELTPWLLSLLIIMSDTDHEPMQNEK